MFPRVPESRKRRYYAREKRGPGVVIVSVARARALGEQCRFNTMMRGIERRAEDAAS